MSYSRCSRCDEIKELVFCVVSKTAKIGICKDCKHSLLMWLHSKNILTEEILQQFCEELDMKF